jgi:hypothetical protein
MSSQLEPINLPNDPRVKSRYNTLNGIKYHYLFAEPKDGVVRETVFLVSICPPLFSW